MKNVVDFENKKFDVSAYEKINSVTLDSVGKKLKEGFGKLFEGELPDEILADMLENLFNKKIKMIHMAVTDKNDNLICSAVIRRPLLTVASADGGYPSLLITEFVEEFRAKASVRFCCGLDKIKINKSVNLPHEKYFVSFNDENMSNNYNFTVLYEDGKEEE